MQESIGASVLKTRLQEAVGEYYRQRECGGTFSREGLLAKYADVAAELESFLATAKEVELFAAGEDNTGKPKSDSATDGVQSADLHCSSLGDYVLLEEIGHGGMGVVYKARQRSLDRLVAIKMILAGPSATHDEVRRLHNEAKLAAKLRHPRIVPIHEVSEHDGRPFFSMDFVDGVSLAERIRESPLPPKQAAEYLVSISEAVHFAHENGILHRDLKPANILLDKDAQPLVTDFGLAKQLAGESSLTESGAIVGTACYMAPEQASGQASSLTSAADVYSLGAILYEMLTGRPPFKAETAWETLLLVRSEEPVAPRRLQPKVPRDLETICLTCLRKEPSKRYSGAKILADDLRRFIDGKPIRARPVGIAERSWRWCRRKPLVASLAGTIIVLILSSLAGLTGLWLHSETQRKLAQDNAEQEEKQRQRAERNFGVAQDTVRRYLTQVSEERILNEPFMKPLRHRLLQLAQEYYQDFVAQHENDESVLSELGYAYYRLATVTAEIDSKLKALQHGEKARDVFLRLTETVPSSTDFQDGLAMVDHALANWTHSTGQLTRAEDLHRQALKIRQNLAREHPDSQELARSLAVSLGHVGTFYRAIGRWGDATSMHRQAIGIMEELARRQPTKWSYKHDLALGVKNLGAACIDLGDFKEAEACFLRARGIWDSLCKRTPKNTQWWSSLAGTHYNLALLYSHIGRIHEVEPALRQALKIHELLAHEQPEDTWIQHLLATDYNNLGAHFADVARLVDAEQAFTRSLELNEKLATRFPEDDRFQNGLARSYANLSEIARDLGKLGEAKRLSRRSQIIFARLAREQPSHWEYVINHAAVLTGMGSILEVEGNPKDSCNWFTQAIQILRRLLDEQPKHVGAQAQLLESYAGYAKALTILNERDAALRAWDEALALPIKTGKIQVRLGRAKTLIHFKEARTALDEVEQVSTADEDDPDALYEIASVYALLGRAFARDANVAEHYSALSVERLRRALSKGCRKGARVQMDKDFDPIRARDDFKKLIAELVQTQSQIVPR